MRLWEAWSWRLNRRGVRRTLAIVIDADTLRSSVAQLAPAASSPAAFDDLTPFGRLVANRRVVQLGEQSHADGATFDLKVRLVRYLHEFLGFDLIAWESGLHSCRRMQRRMMEGAPAAEVLATGLFPIWHVRPVEQLFDYCKAQLPTKPLEMCGFDIQLSGTTRGPDALLADAENALGSSEPESRPPEKEDGTVSIGRLHRLVDALRECRDTAIDPLDIDWIVRSLMGFRASQELAAAGAFRGDGDPDVVSAAINVRDALMADNLLWLLEHVYPGRRVIVWSASFHIARNLAMLTTPPELGVDYGSLVTMGQHLEAALGDDVYTLVFTAGGGRAGNPALGTNFDIDLPNPGSLEAGLLQLGHDCAFLDLSTQRAESPLRGSFEARPFGYAPMVGEWSGVVDGFVFTSSMYPTASSESWAEH